MILNASAKKFGTPIGSIDHDDAADGPHVLKESQSGGYDKPRERFLFKTETTNFSNLWHFLKTLAHEDAHRIDYFNANNGMIGAQLMRFVDNNYVNNAAIGEDLYRKWATEQSSYYLEETTAAALEYMIRRSREAS